MPPPKAEAYLRKLMQQYWSRKTFDSSQGKTINAFNPQSMLDSFWFAKRQGSDGTQVDTLPGGQNLGEITDLVYFVKKLYKSLKVPTNRVDPESRAGQDGMDILREELKFAKFVIRLQQHFASGIKDSFITHLKLREIWEKYELRDVNISLRFHPPTNFYELREQQKFELKSGNFNNMSANEMISESFAQKKYLGWSDVEIKANREWMRKDAAQKYEIANITAAGPNWKEAMEAGAEAEAGMPPMGGGGGMGGGMPPSFGPAPGGEPVGAEGEPGAEAPAGGELPPPPAAPVGPGSALPG
jgi:hypothetical protein